MLTFVRKPRAEFIPNSGFATAFAHRGSYRPAGRWHFHSWNAPAIPLKVNHA
jgi:hypothetical protein